ncbi:MAG: hypothetical protein R3242_07095 [Akkermansiaceae bacterium]|nr:hypothetical protein [Akkermansiaceae bacterium]
MATKSRKTKKSASKSKTANKTANKTAPKSIGKGKRGARYTTKQKQQVVDFVHEYNAKHGRGGQSQAAKKFGLSVLTVASWLRSPKLAVSSKAGKASAVPAGINSKVAALIEVSDQLRKAEAEVSRLREKYDEVRSSVQSLL